MTLEDLARELAEFCGSPDDVRLAIVELVLACWGDSDQSTSTLTALIGSVAAAQWNIGNYLGGIYDGE